MARSREQPPGALVLRTYQELDQFVGAFADGLLNLLLIIGRPGVQKSHAVKAAVGRRACWIDGSATAFGLYCQLYRHRDRPVVIDDVDSLYADRAAVRLLKCLCQTEPRKRLGWYSAAVTGGGDGVPTSFETTSRVAILANELQPLNVNVAAVLDRGHVLVFDPAAREVHLRTADWYWDQEIFDFIGRFLHLTQGLSMRHYALAWELKRAGMDWKSWLLVRWGLTGTRLLVAKLKADASFSSEAERVRAFVKQDGGCRATYFNHAKKLGRSVDLPEIRLNNRPPEQITASLLDLLRRRFGMLGRDEPQ
ncbi:MAG: hypothetical protein ABIG44_07945 [Planctomycetota bacterium]